jgi:copper chaperone CopZ
VARAQEIIIEIDDLAAGEAERRVAEALRAVPGVASVEVSAGERRAVVTADPSIATPERLRSAISEAGQTAGDIHFPE